MTTYKSKIGLELIIPITIIVGGTGILMVYEQIWIGLALIFLIVAFITHMLLTTYYKIENNTLRIKCGFFFNSELNIDIINEIKETNNPISSPATSIDRLLIIYNKYDTVIISPKEKSAFINQLVEINPNIKVTLKENKKQTIHTG
jgi:hypothetical protein